MRLVDLRDYRPASVLVIDLVKHSARPKDVVYEVQHVLEEVFSSVRTILGISDVHYYTGDGYVCALAGDASGRAIDFLNSSIPRLKDRLTAYGQEFRAGLDFGLIHLRDNVLTSKTEFFDSPSIVAARLEHSAQPGQILCSSRFYDIFKDYCPERFSPVSLTVHTKDREIQAFEIYPAPLQDIADLIKAFLLGPSTAASEISDGRKQIYLIDDETAILEIVASMIQFEYPNAKVRKFESGMTALKELAPGTVGLACVDLMMSDLDGIATMEKLVAIDPEITIFVVTAVHDDAVGRAAVKNGAAYYLRKPFDRTDIMSLLDSWETIRQLNRSIRFICEDRGEFLWQLQTVRELRRSVIHRLTGRSDRIAQMIRHRLKNSITECALSVSASHDMMGTMSRVISDMKCLDRLSSGLASADGRDLCENLRAIVADSRNIHNSAQLQLDCVVTTLPERLLGEIPTIVLIVSELLQNALDATKEKGHIALRVIPLPSKGAIQLTVSDDGPGVPRKLRDKVFELGVSTKGEGRGLGLALVSDAVKALGGNISYSYDNGAIFRVILPVQ